jgi:FAD/FMN-containing dehydrogenase
MSAWRGKGTILYRDDRGFRKAVMKTLFNQRDPGRLPQVMIQPIDVDDVTEAIALARRENIQIGICSGGHSWSANHVREGGLLLDMSRFNEMRIDRDRAIATAGPGCGGSDLVSALGKQGLFFPAGHCMGVKIGGYLVQGGFGWHGRKLGMACESVIGLDIVTADGTLVHASEKENADLYWAARGSGGGFFGVVTRFHLRVYPRPKTVGSVLQVYDMEYLDDVIRWARETSSAIPDSIEFQMVMSRRALPINRPGMELFVPVIAQSRKEAQDALEFMHTCPVRHKASFTTPFLPTGFSLLYRAVMHHYPRNHRWNVDNMWTHASTDQLLPGLHRIVETMPPAPAHALWLNWAPPQERPDMAYSVEDQIYLALYGAWKKAEDDAKYGDWATDRMREMEDLSTGIQLADENLGRRTARFVSEPHLKKLDAIRASRDPGHLFHAWLSRP